jgi:GH24 family phage-related lysozyme (muramidase)
MQPQPITDVCLELVKQEEAFIPFVYDDFLEPRHAADYEREWKGGEVRGTLTIGYGTTAPKSRVRLGNRIDRATAESWLREDLEDAAADVARLVKVPLNENQFGALVSFTYNVGAGTPPDHKHGPSGFAGSTLLKLVNAGDYDAVPAQLNRFIFSKGQKMRGLVRRRTNEAALWSTPVLSAQAIDVIANEIEAGAPIVATEVDPEVPMAATKPDAVIDKRPRESKTLWSTGGGLVAVIGTIAGYCTDIKVLMVGGVLFVAAAYILIGTERIRRFFDERVLGEIA